MLSLNFQTTEIFTPMQYFDSNYFTYKNHKLHCENVSIEEITKAAGTPVYIYSKKFFTDRFNEFHDAFKEIPHTIFYASKSNFNLNVIKTFYELGAGIDVNSEGEMFRAIKAGVDPKKMIMSGVGKTSREIQFALENNILMIKAESEEEVEIIDEIAGGLGKKAEVAIRVNPDVDAKSHPYISTGLKQNKFGINSANALRIFKNQSKYKNLTFAGIDMHIGSQITTVSPLAEAVEKLSQVYLELKSSGIKLKHFDVGGGIGVKYNDEKPFSYSEYANAILPTLKKLDCDIFFEPGRTLTANGGILATEVLYTKNNNDKNFIIIDAAMTDLLRPSIYGAYHHIQPVNLNESKKDIMADIVGPVCETGDFIAKDREIKESNKGDMMAIMTAGAYGMTMASNYNARRRAPEIMVDGDRFFILRGRETLEHLLFDEKIVEELN